MNSLTQYESNIK